MSRSCEWRRVAFGHWRGRPSVFGDWVALAHALPCTPVHSRDLRPPDGLLHQRGQGAECAAVSKGVSLSPPSSAVTQLHHPKSFYLPAPPGKEVSRGGFHCRSAQTAALCDRPTPCSGCLSAMVLRYRSPFPATFLSLSQCYQRPQHEGPLLLTVELTLRPSLSS